MSSPSSSGVVDSPMTPALERLAKLTTKARELDPALSVLESREQLEEPSGYYMLEDIKVFWEAFHAGTDLKDAQATRATLLAILTTFYQGGLDDCNSDEDDARDLVESILRVIAPISLALIHDEDDDDRTGPLATDDEGYEKIKTRCLATAEIGLSIVDWLRDYYQPEGEAVSPIWPSVDSLMTLIALGERIDPWTTEEAADKAKEIANGEIAYFAGAEAALWVTKNVLNEYLRPLFEKSKPAGVTSSGRPAAYSNSEEAERGLSDESRKTKPWKYEDLRSISVLSWTIQWANEQFIRSNFGHFVPTLLTLAEDPSTRVRYQGLQLIGMFLDKFPIDIARSSGLLQVFEEAVLPSLNYLPSLTPEDESVRVLEPAFDALFKLSNMIAEPQTLGWQRLPDKIFRQGIMSAYSHARHYPRIVEVLMHQITRMLSQMEFWAVKYLKDIIPMLSAIITDPFASTHKPMLYAAVCALGTTVRNCHVRIVGNDPWQDEIIKVLAMCWISLVDTLAEEVLPDFDEVVLKEKTRDELCKIARELFQFARDKNIDLEAKVQPLIVKEPILVKMFPALFVQDDGSLKFMTVEVHSAE